MIEFMSTVERCVFQKTVFVVYSQENELKFKILPNSVPMICAVNAARGGNFISKKSKFMAKSTRKKKAIKSYTERSSDLAAIVEPD